jgi:argininosuccinate lyase
MTQNQLDKKSEAWSALFSEPMSDLVKRYTASVFFDKRLWQADIQGSLAHAGMLAAQGIIGVQDWPRSNAGWRRSAPRSNPAPSNGSSTWKTCT